MYLWTCKSDNLGSANRKFTNYESVNQKKIGSANCKDAKCMPHLRNVRKFADLRFVELICRPPTFVDPIGRCKYSYLLLGCK
jgi:hypothetical protein